MRASADQVQRCQRRIAQLEMLGMTRKAIAEAAGLSPSSLTRLAQGVFLRPSRATVVAVLAVRPR